MDCVVTPLKTLMGFSVHLNVQLKFYNLPNKYPYFNLKNLMTEFSISKRTALRDLSALEEMGLAIYSERGKYGGYRIISRDPLIPVTFTSNEIAAILFAIHALHLLRITHFSSLIRG